MRLFMIQRHAHDWTNLVAWHRDVLGLKPLMLDDPGRFALLDLGGTKLAIKGRDTAASSHGSDTSLVFEVDDLDAERARLSTLGVAVGPIREHPDERFRECLFADPEGNAITIFAWYESRAEEFGNVTIE